MNELAPEGFVRHPCSIVSSGMKQNLIITLALLGLASIGNAQVIPLDTALWEINAQSYVLETYKGQQAIYLQGGSMSPKEVTFLNGTIEFDIYLKEEAAFPGVNFRSVDSGDMEQFYLRPHLPGKPDANQAAPAVKGVTPWQLYFGPKYSFPYDYKYDDWTHVKIVVNGDKAQVYMDYSEKPHLSWVLFHPAQPGQVVFRGGGASGMHLANMSINHNEYELLDFKPGIREPIEGLVPAWQVSDMFEEKLLADPASLQQLIAERKWGGTIKVEEGAAANISRVQTLYDGSPGETVLARIIIQSEKDQVKLFHFGYSDRVVAILNGQPIYRGNNRWHSRDYRYLGTVGLFDAIYLNLKKGENTLLMAVSEDFGGWLITGKFDHPDGVIVREP
ncbi:MAG: hypothetical protein RIC30_10890 [Marinoscillum sp.]|uniref:hypothetical protein n=1 Tax=Marinoscillum sp. TaxID=2024838 RepID=UPI003302319A